MSLDLETAEQVMWDWPSWARDDQLWRPTEHSGTLYMAGRGWGKTRVGAEATQYVAAHPDLCAGRIILAGRTAADVRSTMLYGESGIMNICPPWFTPKHEPSKRLLTWPHANSLGDNYSGRGVEALTLSADQPKSFRGPQCGWAWLDEFAHWQSPDDAMDQFAMGHRMGLHPRWVGTTTPIPIKLIRELVADADVRIVEGSTYDNRLNLAPKFFRSTVARFEGTRMGEQELWGRLLDDNPNALWQMDWFSRDRMELEVEDAEGVRSSNLPEITRLVVAVDPAVSNNPNSNETGIVVAGKSRKGHYYVFADGSGNYSANGWARLALRLLADWQGDRIVAEVNNGGDLVEATIRGVDQNAPYEAVHATRGKMKRAEPIAALYEQRKVHHVGDPRKLAILERQLCDYDPTRKDEDQDTDRMDALVWALTALSGGIDPRARLKRLGKTGAIDALRERFGGGTLAPWASSTFSSRAPGSSETWSRIRAQRSAAGLGVNHRRSRYPGGTRGSAAGPTRGPGWAASRTNRSATCLRRGSLATARRLTTCTNSTPWRRGSSTANPTTRSARGSNWRSRNSSSSPSSVKWNGSASSRTSATGDGGPDCTAAARSSSRPRTARTRSTRSTWRPTELYAGSM